MELASVRKHGVKAEIIIQWKEIPRSKHHRDSQYVMIALREDFDAVTLWGTRISDRLLMVVEAIGRISIDDSINKSPHAVATSLFKMSYGCSFASEGAPRAFGGSHNQRPLKQKKYQIAMFFCKTLAAVPFTFPHCK